MNKVKLKSRKAVLIYARDHMLGKKGYDGWNFCICDCISWLLNHDKITDDLEDSTNRYLLLNKPKITGKYKEFYNFKYFTDGHGWWGTNHDGYSNYIIKVIIKEKKRYLTAIINKL